MKASPASDSLVTEALHQGNVELLKKQLSHGAETGGSSTTPIEAAVRAGNLPGMRLLRTLGASVDEPQVKKALRPT